MKTAWLLVPLVLMLSGCGGAKDDAKKLAGPPPINVSVAKSEARDLPVLESSVGDVDTLSAPMVAAEVAARVVRVNVEVGDPVRRGQVLVQLDAGDFRQATIAAENHLTRLLAQQANQEKMVARYRQLKESGFIHQSMLDDAETTLGGLQADARAASAELELARHNLARSNIVAPIDGRVQARFVDPGDFIDKAKPVIQLANSRGLQIRLPFPETVAGKVLQGQPVRLWTPAAPEESIEGTVTQIQPMVGAANRAFDALVESKNPGAWKAGASVNGDVTVDMHKGAVLVPRVAVVIRPAGSVVYVVKDGVAHQQVVKTGVERDGMMELVSGLAAGENVVVDGAGYLTDGAKVAVRDKP